MSDAERTQFIARSPVPPPPPGRTDSPAEDEPDRRGALVWLVIVLVLLLVIGGAAAAIFLIGHDKGAPAKVAVPTSLIGQKPDVVAERLRTAGFNPVAADSPTSGPCDDNQKVADGLVCTLDPTAGTQLTKGSIVTYAVFKAATKVVPYVVGLSSTEAVNQLHNSGLNAKLDNVDSSQPAGIVVTQSQPQYKEVPPGTVITLQVSSGKVKLLDVRGKKVADAVQMLNSAGWTQVDATHTADTPDKTKDGLVTETGENPTPGIAYPQSTQITLTYYKFVKATPTCTTPPPTSSSTATATSTPTDTTTPTATATPLPPCTS
jgi:beta-lactam-binding protein with PASTA domain